MSRSEDILADWVEAQKIASKFANKMCLQTAAALAKKFGADATILSVDITPYAVLRT